MGKGPFKLVTVNTAPERAKKLVGRAVDDMRDNYEIVHAANADKTETVASMVEDIRPDVLFIASMWTAEQRQEIQRIAKKILPELRILALYQGLQVEKGADAVVAYIKDNLPPLIESSPWDIDS